MAHPEQNVTRDLIANMWAWGVGVSEAVTKLQDAAMFVPKSPFWNSQQAQLACLRDRRRAIAYVELPKNPM